MRTEITRKIGRGELHPLIMSDENGDVFGKLKLTDMKEERAKKTTNFDHIKGEIWQVNS